MELFHRKGDRTELDRAADSFSAMLVHVDLLGEMIADARGKRDTPADVLPDKVA
jgi:hypothetical protein